MKKLLLPLLLLSINTLLAQSSYTSANYAAISDSFYITNANDLTTDFETAGANHSWDFSTLVGTSQNHLQFRNPNLLVIKIIPFHACC